MASKCPTPSICINLRSGRFAEALSVLRLPGTCYFSYPPSSTRISLNHFIQKHLVAYLSADRDFALLLGTIAAVHRRCSTEIGCSIFPIMQVPAPGGLPPMKVPNCSPKINVQYVQ